MKEKGSNEEVFPLIIVSSIMSKNNHSAINAGQRSNGNLSLLLIEFN